MEAREEKRERERETVNKAEKFPQKFERHYLAKVIVNFYVFIFMHKLPTREKWENAAGSRGRGGTVGSVCGGVGTQRTFETFD